MLESLCSTQEVVMHKQHLSVPRAKGCLQLSSYPWVEYLRRSTPRHQYGVGKDRECEVSRQRQAVVSLILPYAHQCDPLPSTRSSDPTL